MCPQLQASHGQGWQFQISIVTAHIERSNWQIYSPKYGYTLAKNGNFRFLYSHIGRSTSQKHTISSLKSSYNGTLYSRQMDGICFQQEKFQKLLQWYFKLQEVYIREAVKFDICVQLAAWHHLLWNHHVHHQHYLQQTHAQ